MTVEIQHNVLTAEECKTIVQDLVCAHPGIVLENLHLVLDDRFGYLDYIPGLYVDNLGHQIGRYCVSMSASGWYPGIAWHTDGTRDEVSILLYLSGDPDQGGQFCTENSTHNFEPGALFVLDSSENHYVTPYSGATPRLAFKWRYKIQSGSASDPLLF
jgi:hypothetical protein